jgi:hypothetical protein
MFQDYISQLNQIIKVNIAFLNSNLNIDTLVVDVVKPEPSAFFDFFNKNRTVEKATVMV